MDEVKVKFAKRLQAVLDYHKDSVNELAKMLGKSNASLYSLLDVETNHMPTARTLIEIIECYPRVSTRWLCIGEGKMLAENKIKKAKATTDLVEFTTYLEHVDQLVSDGNMKKWKELRSGLLGSFTLQQNELYKTNADYKKLSEKLIDMYDPLLMMSARVKKALEE